jgi:hypothetical protein
MEYAMTAHATPKAPVRPESVPHRKTALVLIAAALLGIAAAVGLAARAPASADGAVDVRSLPPTGAVVEAASPLPIDHSVVQSKQLADEPDMTGASIGAYAP